MEKIGLVVLNYNSSDDTITCVNRLLSFNKGYHIIIVDNNSADDSVAKINEAFDAVTNVDIICNKKNTGYSAGNNLGMKYAVSHYNVDIVGILNPDIIISNGDVIDEIAKVLLSDNKFAVAGGVLITPKNEYNISDSCWNIPTAKEIVFNHFMFNKRRQKSLRLKMCTDNAALTECIAGCFFLAKASVMEEMGYLDENVFLYNEENILGIKCKKYGYKEVIVLDQFYIHNHIWKSEKHKPLKARLAVSKLGYKSRKYLCQTYYDGKLLPLLSLLQFANTMVLILSSAKTYFQKRK
jgi:GT2 family glycosyltransferase